MNKWKVGIAGNPAYVRMEMNEGDDGVFIYLGRDEARRIAEEILRLLEARPRTRPRGTKP